MIRTLHLTNGLGTGGAERSLSELLPDLAERDIQPTVALFFERAEGVEDQVRDAGIDVRHIPGSNWPSRLVALRRLLDDVRPDLVHTALFEADVAGRMAVAGRKIPTLTSLVSTPYDPIRLTDDKIRRSRLRAAQGIDGISAHLARTRFHAISDAARRSAVEHLRLPEERITVIPRGRRRTRLGEPGPDRRRHVRQRRGWPQDVTVLLHVGREEFAKGHAVLFAATGPILRSRVDVHLVLAGRRGNESDAVARHVAQLPPGQVHRLGHVDEVPDLMAAADVFVFPSLYEGLGGAALEAMAMELPIVASSLPAVREFAGGIARFVAPSSAAELRGAIEEVLADLATARARARLGRRRFDDAYEHRHIVGSMAELFHRHAAR